MTVWLKMWFNNENNSFNVEFMPYFVPVNGEYSLHQLWKWS